jgi:3-oxoacid CoA-transferase subunit A
VIKNFICTGDTHSGMSTRLSNINRNMSEYKPEETAIIILGDAGLNFWLNNTDEKYKKLVCAYGYHIYCVRGNHEERPENLDYQVEWDENVNGNVYVDSSFPLIRYFMDGGEYNINGHSVLAIGGAYSIDKWYRLARAGYSKNEAEIADPKKCGWFKDECLTAEEMEVIGNKVANKHYDFVFSHTCPLSWEPTDLFLNCVDQSTVDKSMELWMDELKNHIDWRVWCFGHFHADRIERPCVEQFYMEYENMETIWNRWFNERTYDKEWWLSKSPWMKWYDQSEEKEKE